MNIKLVKFYFVIALWYYDKMSCMLVGKVLHRYAIVAMTPRLTISSQGCDKKDVLNFFLSKMSCKSLEYDHRRFVDSKIEHREVDVIVHMKGFTSLAYIDIVVRGGLKYNMVEVLEPTCKS